MGLLDFFKKGNQNDKYETYPQILKRLEEVSKNREDADKKANRTLHFIHAYYNGEEKDFALLPSDITSKNDIVILSQLLPELNK